MREWDLPLATVNVVVLTQLNRHSAPGNRGRVLGIYQGFFLGGISIGPAVGGIIGAHWGWRTTFLFCAATALVGLAAVLAAPYRRSPGETADKSSDKKKAGR